MNLIFLALSALLILLHVAGLGLLLSPLAPHPALARPVAVVGGCLLLFFVEHLVGLGRLSWLWPLTTAAAAGLCWRRRDGLRRQWRGELVFALAFAYVLAWRLMFPHIDPSSEHLTDLYFIGNYLPGERLPPVDRWLPPYRFDFYYALQHYAAALLGRLFGLAGGTTYNLAFSLLVALIISTAWLVIGCFCRSTAARLLVLFAFVLGGTGVSPLLHGLFDNPPAPVEQGAAPPAGLDLNMWRGMRFIGSMDAQINTELGRVLFPPDSAPGVVPLDLPLETFSYLVFLGDYHPPLGGLLLLLIALACIGLLEQYPADRFAQATLAATLPLTLLTNAWVFPLHGALLLVWVVYRQGQRRPPDWPVLLLAGLLVLLLLYPALAGLAAHVLTPPIAPVVTGEHTPWREGLAVHWPLLGLLLLSLPLVRRQPLALMFVLTWGGLLLFAETFYIDDLYGGQYNRFNTVLKWWSWIHAGALVTLGPLILGSVARWLRLGGALILLLLATYSIDVARLWYWQPPAALANFNGHGWLTGDAAEQAMFDYLAVAPPGIVLERNESGSYSRSSALALFAGQPSLLGWADHEWAWRGSPRLVRRRAEEVTAFYAGQLADSLPWLLYHEVRYIVWGAAEESLLPAAFASISQQIGSAYVWQSFAGPGNERVGLWVLRRQN